MFDLNDELTTRSQSGSPEQRLAEYEEGEGDILPAHPLDSEEMVHLHARLMAYYRQELDRQSENRHQMAIDEDYRDNIQWDEADAYELQQRGQAPLVYNVIATSVRWVINSERRARLDAHVLPRRKEDGKSAERKTQLLKYLSDVNRTPYSRSRAFADAVTVGLGWMEVAIQDETDGEPIYSRYESWRNILWDSAASESDLSDSRYMFRVRWVDLDVAEAHFPDRIPEIRQAASTAVVYTMGVEPEGDDAMDMAEVERQQSTGLYGSSVNAHSRQRVRLIECWYRKPERRQRILKGPWKGQIYDEADPRHQEYVESIGEKLTYTMHVAIMTSGHLLYEGESPYRHNRFPFIPFWGYRRGRDGLPFGMVRGLRDIQDDINKRAAKAQWILSSNKIIMEEGALPDGTSVEDLRDEAARPDSITVLANGKMGSYREGVGKELAVAQLDLMSRGIMMIQSVGGVTDEAMGRTTNAVSGIAIQGRQEQASVTTLNFFDSLAEAEELRGQLELSLCEQFMTEERQFRITNSRGKPEYIGINTGEPEDDITRCSADYIVSRRDYRESVRQANVEQLIKLLTSPGIPPEVALIWLDLVVEEMDLSNRDELVKRLRAMTGQRDPDATEKTPEEIAAEQAKQAQAQMQQQIQEAQLRAAMAKALKEEAEALKAGVSAEHLRAQIVAANLKNQQAALETAGVLAAAAPLAGVADQILAEAGASQSPTSTAPAAPAIPVQP